MQQSGDTLLLRREGCALHITFNRPEARNALSSALWRELATAFAAIESDRGIRAVVLRGAGGNFCAGGDLKERAAIDAADAMWERNRMGGRILTQILRAPQVVIAAIEGVCLGGGLGLACVADVALCTADARFALPEVTLGVLPAQVSPFLVRRLGISQAQRLALTAASLDGADAEQVGLVHASCADAAALETGLAGVLERIARCAPGALAATKRLLDPAEHAALEAQLDRAAHLFVEAARGPEGVEGASAFRDKRKPSWNPSA